VLALPRSELLVQSHHCWSQSDAAVVAVSYPFASLRIPGVAVPQVQLPSLSRVSLLALPQLLEPELARVQRMRASALCYAHAFGGGGCVPEHH
jgi:hypothetical protein